MIQDNNRCDSIEDEEDRSQIYLSAKYCDSKENYHGDIDHKGDCNLDKEHSNFCRVNYPTTKIKVKTIPKQLLDSKKHISKNNSKNLTFCKKEIMKDLHNKIELDEYKSTFKPNVIFKINNR